MDCTSRHTIDERHQQTRLKKDTAATEIAIAPTATASEATTTPDCRTAGAAGIGAVREVRYVSPTIGQTQEAPAFSVIEAQGMVATNAAPGSTAAPMVVRAAPAVAAVAVANPSRNNRALVELRSELGRQLAAVVHALDGGRHLQEATRVMREIEKLEALDRLEAEVCVAHC